MPFLASIPVPSFYCSRCIHGSSMNRDCPDIGMVKDCYSYVDGTLESNVGLVQAKPEKPVLSLLVVGTPIHSSSVSADSSLGLAS